MALPSSGAISFSQIRDEVNSYDTVIPAGPISLSNSNIRDLLSGPTATSGAPYVAGTQISANEAYSKSWRITITRTNTSARTSTLYIPDDAALAPGAGESGQWVKLNRPISYALTNSSTMRSPTSADSFSFATTDVSVAGNTITEPSHGLINGQVVVITSSGTVPGGITSGKSYYVISSTTNTFQISTTYNGSAVDITSQGSGTHTANTNSYAIITGGTYPTGSILAITNNSGAYIVGRGGNGGNGGSFFPGSPGGAGGRSIEAKYNLAISNSSVVGGGGGGGGGGGAYEYTSGGEPLSYVGGGGGGGRAGGAGGGGFNSGTTATFTTTGVGGAGQLSAGDGGAGGTYGANGSSGQSSPNNAGGAGGAAGAVVGKLSSVTVSVTGTALAGSTVTIT